ncbi:MAG: hypothetical protein ABSH07_12925 [Candidatus Dormibacteria bacterium]
MIYDQGTPRPGTEATRGHTGKKSMASLVMTGGLLVILGIQIRDERKGVGQALPPSPSPS